MSVYCQKCKTATAVVHVTELREGKQLEVHLCEPCADASDYAPKAGQSSMLEFLQQFMENASKQHDRRCPDCGMTFNEFKAKGRFGCARDYDVFLPKLLPLLERMHDASEHLGTDGGLKVPEHPEATKATEPSVRERLRRLKRQLAKAVKAEKYEEAATFRDEIRNLERSAEGEGSSK